MTDSANRSAKKLDHPFDRVPEAEELFEVGTGVFWVRMPLDLTGLDHINLWLLADGEGWTLVDTGMNSDTIREHWDNIFADKLGGKPITRVICTHFHPDHMGLAGWVTEKFGCQLWMSRGEWTFGRMVAGNSVDSSPEYVVDYYRAIGLKEDALDRIRSRGTHSFRTMVWPIPQQFHRIKHDDNIKVGDHTWRIVKGTGHSPEHSCLVCDDLKLMISGDQVLPRITPHIGVYPDEPEGNPLQDYIDSLHELQALSDDLLVLPSHGDPFRGLHKRLAYLIDHHNERLDALEEFVVEPTRILSTLKVLFHRRLGDYEALLGLAEALAHLNCLIAQGRVARTTDDKGVWIFTRPSADAAAA